MKIGIVRKIDSLGRAVIPREMRKVLNIDNGDEVNIYIEERKIIIEPYEIKCEFCGNKDWTELVKKDGRHICKGCLDVFVKGVIDELKTGGAR
jgi:AbrB family transcriptional regulator, transcriptional pleiotropic regulator of transition state genes